MAKKKEKTIEQIKEEVSFMLSIKNSVPDHEYRVSEIYRLYADAKKKMIKKISWGTLVASQGPGTNEVSESDWKRFVGLYKSHKKLQIPVRNPDQITQEPGKKEPVTQASLFPNSFNTSGY